MELKIFRDALPAAGASCTLKAELPLETEILISDYLPPSLNWSSVLCGRWCCKNSCSPGG